MTPLCEFTYPCQTTGRSTSTDPDKPNPTRKVISHIFGRNKTATKLFPVQVWVHYCRRHYQRARYRSAARWAFTQCALMLVSLDRMEEWGGVSGFEVRLRRREVLRLARAELALSLSSSTSTSVAGSAAGAGAGAGAGAALVSSSSALGGREHGREGEHEHEHEGDNDDGDRGGTKKSGGGKRKRRKPRIVPSPVPEWLRQEAVGMGRSFDDVRRLIERIKADLEVKRNGGEEKGVGFPDIEILPTFHEWVTLDSDSGREREEEPS